MELRHGALLCCCRSDYLGASASALKSNLETCDVHNTISKIAMIPYGACQKL